MKLFMMVLCFFVILCISNVDIANCEEIDISGYNKCIEKDISTFGMTECAAKATNFWDKKLNVAYKKLMSMQETAEKKKILKDAQLSWIRYRDKTSSLYTILEEGSIAQLNANVWYMEATKDRAKFLEAFIQEE